MLAALEHGASVDAALGLTLESLDRRGRPRRRLGAADRTAGRASDLRARYLVGCDGAAQRGARPAGDPVRGSHRTPQRWLVVDALVDRPLRKVPHPHFVGDAARPMVTLPMSPGRHRWEWMLHPGEDAAPHLEPGADPASG